MSLRHRDAFGRVVDVASSQAGREHYLRPHDGRLVRLQVQGTDNAYGYGQRSWARNGRQQSRVSAIMRLARWTYSSVLVEGTEERRYNGDTIVPLALRWIPSCLLLVLLLLIPQNLEGVFKNGGFYDPVQYRDWRYAKVPRNRREGEQDAFAVDEDNKESQPLLEGDIEMRAMAPHAPSMPHMNDEKMEEEFDDLPARHFRPRYLCFLKDGPRGQDTEYETWKVTDWIKQHSDYASTDFVLVSYTRNQFLISADQKWRNKPVPDEATQAAYRQQADEDRALVLAYGMEAARSAGKRAFWIDFECIRDADNVARARAQSNDVYRICDIVRAAHSLVVLVGPPHDSRPAGERRQYAFDAASMDQWLQEWGTRLWTLPEILLCSPERRVKLYAVGGPNPPEEVAKRNIAARSAWPDAKQVRQLVDHYESSIHLTPLELVSIALECFSWRQTDQFNNGDISYALMGLLRRRPAVDKSDTSFEAFARLSLANDSDKLLERLICMQPTRRDAPWHKIRDAWGAKLWDIEPRCQVAGIVDDQTVTLDGAFGATIQWNALEQVAFLKRPTLSRLLGKILLRGVPAYLIFGLALTISAGIFLDQQNNNLDSGAAAIPVGPYIGLLVAGLVFLIPSAIITLLIPVMLLNIYQGKFWSTQAHFLGIEGIPDDIGEIERLLFGFNHGRLRWSIAGSTLSRNGLSEDGERLGLRPLNTEYLDNGTDDEAAEVEQREEETVFTLIDTYAMTATAFRATRPPTTVIVCGHEGGMQRAILCSYDWQKATFVREAVIRVKTLVLDRMFRVDRFRFALGRSADDASRSITAAAAAAAADAAGHGAGYKESRFWDRWKIDLSLLPLMWVVYGLFSSFELAAYKHLYLHTELAAVGFLLAQPANYFLFRKVHMGHLVGAAALIKGVVTLIAVFVNNDYALLFLHVVLGISHGIVTPAFVYLTGLWYDGAWGRVLRIMIWASGDNTISIAWATACILLSGYAYLSLGTPEQAVWLWETRRSASVSDRPWNSTSVLQLPILFRRVRTFFFFFAFLLVSACEASTRFRNVAELPVIVLEYVFPLLLVLPLVVLFTQIRYAQIPIIISLLTISFGGKLQLSLFMDFAGSSISDGLYFLAYVAGFDVIFTWALLLTDMVEPEAFLGTLCMAFSGGALGSVIVGGYIASVYTPGYSGYSDYSQYSDYFYAVVPDQKTVIITFYALTLPVLMSWSVYRWWGDRQNRERTATTAIAYHPQADEQSYGQIDDRYQYQATMAPEQSQVAMESHYNTELPYGSVQHPMPPAGIQGRDGYHQVYA